MTLRGFKSNLQHRAVARALAAWREESGLSLKEASDAAKWSSAKTSMMQNAACPISECDVIALALVYNVNDEQREPVYLGARRARDHRAFDRISEDSGRCIGWTYDEIEDEAHHLRVVAGDTLPHIVRTPEYANAILAAQVNSVREREHPYRDELRTRVNFQLHEGPTLRLHVILSEAILRRPVGGAPVMTDQLIRLMELTELSGVTIQIVPDALGALAATSSQFSMLSFREDRFDDVVYIENLHGAMWLEAEQDREPYAQKFASLTEVALSPVDSLEIIAEAAQQLQDRPPAKHGVPSQPR